MQVYKVLAPNKKLFALKMVLLKANSKELIRGFKEEHDKLQSLSDAPGVIDVFAYEECLEEKMLLMCMELGELDVGSLLKLKRAQWKSEGHTDPFIADPVFICSLWHDMLRAVKVPLLPGHHHHSCL